MKVSTDAWATNPEEKATETRQPPARCLQEERPDQLGKLHCGVLS